MARGFYIAAACALALASGAVAQAQTKPAAPALAQDQAWVAKDAKKSLTWSEGRWGLKLDYDQPLGRQTEWEDVEAGAFFKLSPSLRVGGSLGLGDKRPDPAKTLPENRDQPRVRLETTFRF